MRPGNFIRRRRLAAIAFAAAIAVVGCDKERGETVRTAKTVPTPPPANAERAKSAPSPPANRKPPNAADAVNAVLVGVRHKRPEALWTFLPASYQRDVNETVHLFARRMDPELWSRTFSVGRRLVRLGRSRKEEILNSRAMQSAQRLGRQRLAVEWDATLDLANMLLNSELSDLKQLGRFDGGKFLQFTGLRFLQRLATASKLLPGDALKVELDELADFRATLVSTDGDSAVVELSLVGPEAARRRIDFVRVEGKWVPRSLAANWKPTIAALRRKIEAQLAPDVLQARKSRVLKDLAVIEKSLDALESAKTAGEFQKRFAGSPAETIMVGLFRSAMRPEDVDATPVLPKGVGRKTPKKGTSIALTVVVQGALDAETAEDVADKLFELGPRIDVGPYTIADGTTRYPVSSVANFEAFRRSITFADVVSADAAKREIVVRLKK